MNETAIIISGLVILGILIFLSALIIFLDFQLRKAQNNPADVSQLPSQMGVMVEKLSHIEAMPQTMTSLQLELRTLQERLSTVENNQSKVAQNIDGLAFRAVSELTRLQSMTTGLNESTGAMRQELNNATQDLSELHGHVKAGQESEHQIAESIRRLETVMAGTQSKGSAGENILEVIFSKLPVEWQVRNYPLSGKIVEFALRLPNQLIMPIDSKWPATSLIEQFTGTEDLKEQQKLKKEIEDVVMQKAKEVRKYLDPNVTVNFGIAVVPDAVYDLCTDIQSDTYQLNVILVSYSMFIPYLLLVFEMNRKAIQNLDLKKMETSIEVAQKCIHQLQGELEGRFSKSLIMMSNSREDMRAMLGSLQTTLTGLQISTNIEPALPEPEKNLPSESL